jgi:NTP pyrophosphatase (non-canonical NTP hydrolase)
MEHTKRPDVGDPALERNEFEALHAFQRIMFDKLKANRHKGGWKNASKRELFERLRAELTELQDEMLHGTPDPDAIAKECADVANFAMMIADVVGGLRG